MADENIKDIFNEIREIILAWLSEATDLTVVIEGESDPRPDPPFVSFKMLTGLVKIGGHDEQIAANATAPFTIRSHREFTISVNAVGKPVGNYDDLSDKIRATDILTDVELSLQKPTVIQRLKDAGLAVIHSDSIVDLSQIIENETEPRAKLDIILRLRIDRTDDPGVIEHVQLSGAFDSDMDGNADDIIFGPTDIP